LYASIKTVEATVWAWHPAETSSRCAGISGIKNLG